METRGEGRNDRVSRVEKRSSKCEIGDRRRKESKQKEDPNDNVTEMISTLYSLWFVKGFVAVCDILDVFSRGRKQEKNRKRNVKD